MTSVAGSTASEAFFVMLTRRRLPSGDTSTGPKLDRPELGAFTVSAATACGTPKTRLLPRAPTSTAMMWRSSETKKICLPSYRQRGDWPPAVDTCNLLVGTGKLVIYSSNLPDSFEA